MKRLLLALTLALCIPLTAHADADSVRRLFDWGGHDAEPWGAVQFRPWAVVNPAAGVYDWSQIDRYLEAVKPKTVQLFVTVSRSESEYSGVDFSDDTPSWAPQGHLLDSGSASAIVPAYDNSNWRLAYFAFVRAMGARYDADPRVASVIVSVGLDSETQIVKYASANWGAVVQGSSLEYRWGQFVPAAMQVYREAFPTKPLYLNSAPGQGRMARAAEAAKYNIGLKHAGMWYDLDSYQGYGGQEGSWDAMRAYSMTLPIAVESPHWGAVENLRWSLYAGLHYWPREMSLHPDYFVPEMADMIAWTAAHVNVTLADTPSVWSVLRDWEYLFVGASGRGVSGKMGNWEQGLRVSGGKRVWRSELPAIARDDWRSRQCRMGDAFDVILPETFVRDRYTLRLTYLDTGAPSIAVYWGDALGNRLQRVWAMGNTGQWLTTSVELVRIEPGAAILIESNGQIYLHMVEIVGENNPPTPTATTTATWTATPTATVQEPTKDVSTCTPTATWTATVTATPTVSTSTPTVTETFTPTPTPYPTEAPTPTPSIEDEMRRLAERYEAERGAALRFVVDVSPY